MAPSSEPLKILRSRVTKHGLLTLFSDGHVYLFHNTFLADNRLQHADRVVDGNAIKSMLAEAKPTSAGEHPGGSGHC